MFMFRSLRKCLLGTALVVSSVCAEPLIFVPSDALANDMLTSMLANEVLQDATRSGKGRRAGQALAPRTAGLSVRAAMPRMPEKLAAHYPPAQRAEATRTFATLLATYRSQMEPRLGIAPNDLAGAVAAFLAGGYMAYHNVDFPDEQFKPLVDQMRRIISTAPEYRRANEAEKQDMYEQMAILGMFMASTQMALKTHPSPQVAANIKQAAKGYLEQFLKTDADRVLITAQGLELR